MQVLACLGQSLGQSSIHAECGAVGKFWAVHGSVESSMYAEYGAVLLGSVESSVYAECGAVLVVLASFGQCMAVFSAE